MKEFQFVCPACKNLFITFSRTDVPPCPVCNNPAPTRQYIFQTRASVPEHFNVATGQYVNNTRELRDALARHSDEQSERTGIEHNLEYLTPSEMRDPSAHGVTDEGLEDQRKAWHDGPLP
jgi:hypothetical protein